MVSSYCSQLASSPEREDRQVYCITLYSEETKQHWGDRPEAALLDASRVFYSTLQQLGWLRADHHQPFPNPLAPLVGREHEVAEIGVLFRRLEARLLTLTGSGGVGKTRVALAVASNLLNELVDGVYLVLLAPVSDPTLGSMIDSITRVFPPVSQMQSASCPSVTGFHPLSTPMGQSSGVLLCWMLNLYHPFLTLNQEANMTGVLLTIDSPIQYIVRLTSLPPFPAICPDTIRC